MPALLPCPLAALCLLAALCRCAPLPTPAPACPLPPRLPQYTLVDQLKGGARPGDEQARRGLAWAGCGLPCAAPQPPPLPAALRSCPRARVLPCFCRLRRHFTRILALLPCHAND